MTEEEAAVIEKETIQETVEVTGSEEVEEEVRKCTKACWGNLAACYISLVG